MCQQAFFSMPPQLPQTSPPSWYRPGSLKMGSVLALLNRFANTESLSYRFPVHTGAWTRPQNPQILARLSHPSPNTSPDMKPHLHFLLNNNAQVGSQCNLYHPYSWPSNVRRCWRHSPPKTYHWKMINVISTTDLFCRERSGSTFPAPLLHSPSIAFHVDCAAIEFDYFCASQGLSVLLPFRLSGLSLLKKKTPLYALPSLEVRYFGSALYRTICPSKIATSRAFWETWKKS